MRKLQIFVVALIGAFCVSCEQVDLGVMADEVEVTFRVEGDFQSHTFTRTGGVGEGLTRAALTANGSTMTDLWLFDYMDGALVQTIHQTSDDDDFGTPTLPLAIGDHDLYFVVSRGATPTLNTTSHKITWLTPRDTFWKHITKTIATNSAVAQSVTLDRAATRLTITITDAIAEGTASVEITPATWYYGIDYITGNATDPQENSPIPVTIPSTRIGTAGQQLSIYSLALASEFTTDFFITARDGNDDILGTAAITAAPFRRNRTTIYSGRLFSAGSTFTLTLNDAWDAAYEDKW